MPAAAHCNSLKNLGKLTTNLGNRVFGEKLEKVRGMYERSKIALLDFQYLDKNGTVIALCFLQCFDTAGFDFTVVRTPIKICATYLQTFFLEQVGDNNRGKTS